MAGASVLPTVLAEEEGVPWRVRMHERSVVEYAAHLVVASRGGTEPGGRAG